ncbi:DUF6443 domain-containing protein [Chryseolinea sp. H1M3-3]|uniref:DUF6443 domain-containing protein n=1 Tax=Chryseolinea sp. H1M3-3 TaxID=3034144 RepID=UPI0023ED5A62|nr:DUF6443 domain-containing protein [Chryseolinea sp. H1M3-3]
MYPPYSGSAYSPSLNIANAVTPSVSITGNPNNVCVGTAITFQAVPTNGGTPYYSWKVNGNPAPGSTNSATYVTSALTNGQQVTCVMTTSLPCVTQQAATSNAITMSLTSPSPVSVNIISSPMPFCNGVGSFSASVSNGGSNPTYTWYRGPNVATDNQSGFPSVYAPSAAFADGVKVKCVVTSNQTCVSGNPATSNEITVSSVTNPITPSMLVDASPANFCAGSSVTFTATPTQSGYSITNYSWKLNGAPVGTNSSTYTAVINSTSTVSVTCSVNGSCLTSTTADGSTTVGPVLTTVGLTPSGSKAIFSNESINIKASPIGIGYSYVWKLNGVALPGATGPVYTTNTSGTYTVDVTLSGCTKTSASLVLTRNTAPTVIVSNQTITLPTTSASILATASDPDGSIDSYLWSQLSGPVTAVLTNTTTATLTATGLTVAGVYIFRIIVTDNSGETAYADATVTVTPLDNNYNYIRETTVNTPGKKLETDIPPLSIGQRNETIKYFDGLGRPMENVITQGSPSSLDLVYPIVYDKYGRQSNKYLPFTATGESTGYYKPVENIIANISGVFQNGAYQGIALPFYQLDSNYEIADDSRPFSETVFEASPLKRPSKEYGPGYDWSSTQKNKFVQHLYLTNLHDANINPVAGKEKVISWIVNVSGLPVRSAVTSGYILTGGYYADGQLAVEHMVDEQGNITRAYTNKKGQVILKKVQAAGAGTNLNTITDWALTYYIYDDFNNLRFVFQPELSKKLHAGADTYVVTATDLSNFAFQYKYDGRKRMIEKQVPGVGAVYMIYDKRDRLIMTQDANQRAGGTKYWSFTKYDAINRPVMTGTYISASSPSTMQLDVDTYYGNLTSAKAWSESYIGSVVGNIHGYDNKSFPQETNVNNYLSVTYYDNYAFRSLMSGNYNYSNESLNSGAYTQPVSENLQVTGHVTGTKVKVLDGGVVGGANWLNTVSYYDQKNNVIQNVTDNVTGGQDRSTSLYDFTGKLLMAKTNHLAWKNFVNVAVSGNTMTKNAGANNTWNAGAVSRQQLPQGVNGWVEVKVSETTTNRMIGFSDADTDASYTSLDYAIYLNGANARAYENGTARGTAVAIATGDALKIERIGTAVKYYKNGGLIYTSTVPSNTALMVDASLYSTGATLKGIRTSFDNITRRYIYDHGNRLLETWHRINSQTEVRLVYNVYNELGQLIDKKLHSFASQATDAKQSVDYRYNIRGALSSINNAELTQDTNNDDTGDFFGMNLGYNDNIGTGVLAADLLYNGNISSIKWSVNQGFGPIKEMAYKYRYDKMSRLLTATHRQAQTIGTWLIGQFDEGGLQYDLNGNITKLLRNGDGAVLIDNLTYDYGAGSSNRLLYITDSAPVGTKSKGFYDGSPANATEYTYDANGNMTRDINKGIGTDVSDNINIITYNHLNLPETVTKGGNSIRYIYDALGNKLAQIANAGSSSKRTDYVGEFVYENDFQQFISHEEGRATKGTTKLIVRDAGDSYSNMSSINANLATYSSPSNGENYVSVTSNGTARSGISAIGGTVTVQPGYRYRIRAKGYRTTNPVYISIKVNNVDLNWPGAALPQSATTESWVEQIITIPAGGSNLPMQVGLTWNAIAANGEIFYLNEFEITQLISFTNAEYQYHLKDHLGNIRVTFTTATPTTQSYTATFETGTQTSEQSNFINYSSTTYDLVDHTDAGTTYQKVQWLNGGASGRVGLAKSIAVMPGDQITASAWCKYMNLGSTGNATSFLTALAGAFGVSSGSVGDQLKLYNGFNSYAATVPGGDHPGDTEEAPKAFVTILFFDRNYNLINASWDQVNNPPGAQTSPTVKQPPHDQLTITATAPVPGYAYIFLSNEHPFYVDVYYDDVSFSHTPSPIVSTADYYPFGLTFNSYTRENTTAQDYNYNGKELQDELNLNWLDYGARMYMPEIGRWGAVDALSGKFQEYSPYSYALNNPVNLVDIFGTDVIETDSSTIYTGKDAEDFMNNRLRDEQLGFKSPRSWFARKYNDLMAKGYLNKAFDFQESLGNSFIGRIDLATCTYVIYVQNDLVRVLSFGMTNSTGTELFNLLFDLYKGDLEFMMPQDLMPAPNVQSEAAIFAPGMWREAFVKAYPKFARFYRTGLMQVHHRIPRDYRDLFGHDAVDNLSNLVALPTKLHYKVSNVWTAFKARFPNPTQKQVSELVREIDQIISEIANNLDGIKKY